MAERIRVSGFRPPHAAPRHDPKVRTVAAIRPLNLVGPAGAFLMVAAVLLWGTPHLLLFTRSTGDGAFRVYDDCAYAGLDGRMVHRRGTSCPLFRLMKS